MAWIFRYIVPLAAQKKEAELKKLPINRFYLRIARKVYAYYLEERKEGKFATQNFVTWSNLQLIRHNNFINNKK